MVDNRPAQELPRANGTTARLHDAAGEASARFYVDLRRPIVAARWTEPEAGRDDVGTGGRTIKVDPESQDFEISKWPFFAIVQLSGRYHLRLDAVLKPIGMDVARWRTLMIVSTKGGATVTEIADIAVTKMSTMAKIIQRMTAQGLVVTRASTEDGRRTLVTITEPGLAVLQQIRAKVARLSEQAFRDISEDQLADVDKVLNRIHDNLRP